MLLPQTGDSVLLVIGSEWTETGTTGDKKRRRGDRHPGVFMHSVGAGGDEGLPAPATYFRGSSRADGEAEPSARLGSADNSMCCLEGRELGVINLTTSLTAH